MSIKRVFICIVVLALWTGSCQQPPAPLVEPTSTPAAALASAPTATQVPTAIPPSDTATPVPQATPTAAVDHTPVIKSVLLRPVTSGGEMTVYEDISFTDAKGDVYYVDYTLKSATSGNPSVRDGDVNAPEASQQSGAMVTGTWDCGSERYDATLTAVLDDKAGNKSAPYEFTIQCNPAAAAAVAASSFPDTFEDNRNSWDLDENISMVTGILQFRNIDPTISRWIYCGACKASAENNAVSVEASWSNTPEASLGLLIDDSTCTPDGLVFIIAPVGYYSILQAVRDDQGKWKNWRSFVEWTKSSLIRRAPNAKNVISAAYEFGDELHVTFSLNGSRVNRVRVFGYNGSSECRPGLFADGGLDANFDNFNIAPAKP